MQTSTQSDTAAKPIMTVRDFKVGFATREGVIPAVDGVDLELYPGEVLALVGESGSGKSAMSMGFVGLNRGRRTRIEGSVDFAGRDLVAASEREMRDVRGRDIAVVFQDALAALNPLKRVGDQVVEMIRQHQRVSKSEARAMAIELLREVGIARPEQNFSAYPHEYSGGMRQRAMIAIALANDPRVLIADEPTTALDVTIQAQILDLLKRLQSEHGTSIILVTHDLGVVAGIADRVAVMYSGRIVEIGPRDEVLYNAQHPYTQGLMASTPKISSAVPDLLPAIPGAPPLGAQRPQGCSFSPRCAFAHDKCREAPTLESRDGEGHRTACWLGETVPVGSTASVRVMGEA